MPDSERLRAVLLATAIGDAIGLPFEGLAPAAVERRRARLGLEGEALDHSLVGRHGMISDDTEHACLTVLAWHDAGGDVDAFGPALARRLRWWLLALPPATGLATGRAIVRLWLGWPPERSGGDSAGNGPLMRAPVLGLLARDDAELCLLVRSSTRMTHRDARAEAAALLLARWLRGRALDDLLDTLDDDALRERSALAAALARAGASVAELRASLGFEAGVSGFVGDTLPALIFCVLRWPGDAAAAIEAALRLGGDTDSVAALVAALVVGRGAALPHAWLAGVIDRPLGVAWIERLVAAVAARRRPPRLAFAACLVRNLAMLAIVLAHGFGRLLRGEARRLAA